MSIEVLNTILNYIAELGPAFTSILSIIVSVIIAVKKFGGLSKDSVSAMNQLAEDIRNSNDKTQEENEETKKLLKAVILENAELKKEIKEIAKMNSRIKEPEKDE